MRQALLASGQDHGWRIWARKSCIHAFVAILLALAGSIHAQTFTPIGSSNGANVTGTTNTSTATSVNVYPTPFGKYYDNQRAQYLYRGTELSAAGVPANVFITDIRWNVTNVNGSGSHTNYTVKVGPTTDGQTANGNAFLTSPPTQWGPTNYTPVTGANTFALLTPFMWDGSSNIIIEVCHAGTSNTQNALVSWQNNIAYRGCSQTRTDGNTNLCASTTGAGNQSRHPWLTLGWELPAACTGTPSSGTIFPTTFDICPNTNTVITATGASLENGITYQWQQYSGSIWVNAVGGSGSTTTTYTTPALVNATQYRLNVICTNSGLSSPTNTATVTPAYTGPCYCAPLHSSGCGTTDQIARVVLGSLDNATGCSGPYTYYGSATVPNITQNSSYIAKITFGSDGSQYSAVWIDWDQDGSFDDAGEYLGPNGSVGGNQTFNKSFTVPIGATPGQTIMRIRGGNDAQPTSPCGTSGGNYGETEDYRVNVLAIPPCTGAPPVGTVAPVSTVCPYTTVVLSASGSWGAATGFTYQWEEFNGSTWVNAVGGSGATTTTYTTPDLAGDKQYRLKVRCTPSGQNSITGPVTVTVYNTPAFPQSFTSATFPPDCWTKEGAQASDLTRQNSNGFGAAGTGSARFGFWGTSDAAMTLLSPITAPSLAGSLLAFDVAGRGYTADHIDRVYVETSTNGGSSWSQLVLMNNADGGQLNTAGSLTTQFTAPTAAQWVSYEFTLPTGTNRVRFRGVGSPCVGGLCFLGIGTHAGNNAFFDNIRIRPICTSAPDAGTASLVGPPVGCYGQTATLTSTANNSSVAGVAYEWQVNYNDPNEELDWEALFDGQGLNSTTYTTAPLDASDKYYRLAAVCTATNENAYSGPVFVQMFEPPPISLVSNPANALICASGSVQLTVSGSDINQYLWSTATNLTPNVNAATVTVNPSTTRSYTVVATNASGCTATEGVTVRVEINPTATTTASPTTICQDGTLVLTTVAAPVPAIDYSNPVVRSALSGPISMAIPDAESELFSSTVPGAVVFHALNVTGSAYAPMAITVHITTAHPSNSDLDFWLAGPANCGTMEISTRNGGAAPNYSNAKFTAPAGALPLPPTTPTNGMSGNYRAEGNLTVGVNIPAPGPGNPGPLVNCPVNGQWRLYMRDIAAPLFSSSAGSLTNWQIHISEPGSGNYTHTVTAGPGTPSATVYTGTSNSTGNITMSNIPPGNNIGYTVTTTAPTGCAVTSSTAANITVVQSPTVATVGGAQAICINSTSAPLGGNAPAPGAGTGAWSVTGGTGTFNPNNTTPNATFTHTGGAGPLSLTWTISNPPCAPTTASVAVTIDPKPQASAGGSQTICSNETAPVTVSSASNGTIAWTHNGAGSLSGANTLTPVYTAALGDGGNDVVLTLTVTSTNACAPQFQTAIHTVHVNAVPVMTCPGNSFVCILNAPVALSGGLPAGGTYSGTGVSGGVFDPVAAGGGAHIITYSSTNGNNCTNTCTFTITVDPDTDGDLVCDADDNCPTVPGQVGSACDANPGTGFTLGALNGSCACIGVTCSTDLSLDITMPSFGTLPNWELRDATNNTLVQSGGGAFIPSPGLYQVITCLPDGRFFLKIANMPAGGAYKLRTADNPGVRLIDNTAASAGNSQVTGFIVSPAALSSTGAIQLPVGPTELLFTSCDKYFWATGEYVVVNQDQDVADTWIEGASNVAQSATSGYDFWFYNPNGGYSFIRQRRNNVSDNFGNVGSARTCHMKVNNWAAANHIPDQLLLNLRVRAVVNNVPKNWGPACRFVRDEALALCQPSKLMDVPGNPYISCNVTRKFNNQTVNRLYARAISGATKYRFTFYSGEGTFSREVTTYYLTLGWNANTGPILTNGQSYNVTVEAFKNGAYCVAGEACSVTICNNPPACAGVNGGQQNSAADNQADSEATLNLWPNPNQGDQLYMSLNNLEEGVLTVSMDLYDLSGKRVIARTIAAQGGFINTVVDLNGELSGGLYMVQITAGSQVYTQRLVIQP